MKIFLFVIICITINNTFANPVDTSRSSSISLATFNIQYHNLKDTLNSWENRRELVVKLIKKYDIDIIGAQEPFKNQIQDLLTLLPEYAFWGNSVTGDSASARRHFNPIFYKKDRFSVLDSGSFWFSETPKIKNTKSWDSYSSRMCNWVLFHDWKSGKRFYHFNMHFDHIGKVARMNSAEILRNKIEEIVFDNTNVIVTGDFNENQHSVLYKTMTELYNFHDPIITANHTKNTNWHSLNNYQVNTTETNGRRIDHIFYYGKTKTIYFYSWQLIKDDFEGKYPSDHFPIMVSFGIK